MGLCEKVWVEIGIGRLGGGSYIWVGVGWCERLWVWVGVRGFGWRYIWGCLYGVLQAMASIQEKCGRGCGGGHTSVDIMCLWWWWIVSFLVGVRSALAMAGVGQNRIYTPYMTVCMVISLLNIPIPYVHCIYV
jgi:hypothetical protein